MRRKKRWLVFLLLALVVVGVLLARREPHIPAGSFVVVELGGSYAEAQPTDLVGQLVGGAQPLFLDVLQELRKVAADARLQGVLLKITPFDLDFAQVQELRAALQAVQQAGKQVIAWVAGESTSGNREYYLASVADKVYFAETALLPLTGLQATYYFLGEVWEHLAVELRVEQMAEYKTLGDQLVRTSMSEAHREMANALLDSLNAQFLADIAAARGMTPAQVQALIDTPLLTPQDFLQAGLIDGIAYDDEVVRKLGPEVKAVPLRTYRRVRPASLGLGRGPKIAVVAGAGTLVPAESGWSAMGQTLGAKTLAEALEQAAADDTIRAIVLRLDSPGGSVLAADLLWRAVKRATARKPVVVSMAGVAASGGYYAAAGASKIVALPATLTGSIGVVFLLPNVQGLLAKLGVHAETLTRGRYADLFSPLRSWSAAERQTVEQLVRALYQRFTRKVAEGRGLPPEAVERLARGRVWTGAQAQQLGLVDALGGFEVALQLAKEAANIPAEAPVQLVRFPRAPRLLPALLQRLRGQSRAASPWPRGLQRLLALPAAPPGPLLVMPWVFDIR